LLLRISHINSITIQLSIKFHLLEAKRGKRGHNLLHIEEKGFLPETEYAEAAASREEATLMVSRNDEV